MASSSTLDVRYFDKATGKTYRVVRVENRSVLLESDDSVQIMTTTLRLITRYEPLITVLQ